MTKHIPHRDAAARLGSSTRLLHRLAREGRLQKIKLPGRVRCRGILESDLDALLAHSETPAA